MLEDGASDKLFTLDQGDTLIQGGGLVQSFTFHPDPG